MAVMKLNLITSLADFISPRSYGDSAKARKVVSDSYKKAGERPAELERVYGEYLRYKRDKEASQRKG